MKELAAKKDEENAKLLRKIQAESEAKLEEINKDQKKLRQQRASDLAKIDELMRIHKELEKKKDDEAFWGMVRHFSFFQSATSARNTTYVPSMNRGAFRSVEAKFSRS